MSREISTQGSLPVVQADHVSLHFPVKRDLFGRTKAWLQAVDDVSLDVLPGRTVAIVGESGSGKTTLGRIIAKLLDPTDGRIYFRARDMTSPTRGDLREMRRGVQMVFQNPKAALNPRMTVEQLLDEPLYIHGVDRAERALRISELLDLIGLSTQHASRYVHEVSGGQAQRVAIARALAMRPELVVLDEPVSALDVSVQAQIIHLLNGLQRDLGLAFVFISHDLSVVSVLADEVVVMYLGKVVEAGEKREVFGDPRHPYTQALISAIPATDPSSGAQSGRIVLGGDIPNPVDPPSGCRFRTRCWKAQDLCTNEVPKLRAVGGHRVACHFPASIPVVPSATSLVESGEPRPE